jgi:RNA polymerase sigma-70 factor (ECF subfamily)
MGSGDPIIGVRAGWARAGPSEAILTQQWTAQRPTEDEAADVGLACGGDREAFERLYRLHVARIHGLACRMGGIDRAEDLTQDVFVRAWEKLRSFRGESQFGTWLYRLAINLIVEDRRRPASRWRRQDDDGEVLRNLSVRPANAAFTIDFEAAVNLLPEAARKVFVLHDVEGYKHREIGKLVGITSGTSKGQLHRARMILRRYLGRSVATSRDTDV